MIPIGNTTQYMAPYVRTDKSNIYETSGALALAIETAEGEREGEIVVVVVAEGEIVVVIEVALEVYINIVVFLLSRSFMYHLFVY